MADDIDEAALYIKLLKGTVLTLQGKKVFNSPSDTAKILLMLNVCVLFRFTYQVNLKIRFVQRTTKNFLRSSCHVSILAFN